MELIFPFKDILHRKDDEQNKNFKPFIFIPNLFNNEEIELISNLWNENKMKEGKVKRDGEGYVNYNTRKSKIVYLDVESNEWLYGKLAMICMTLNANMYKFDIRGFQTKLQLSRYGLGDFFAWHLDLGNANTSIRKLSISVQLSEADEYEGGDLQFLGNDTPINAPRHKGTAIIFPSYIYHRVTPVTSGLRKSLVGWIAGPPYR